MSTHYGSVPNPTEAAQVRGYGMHPGTGISDFALGHPSAANPSPLAQSVQQPYSALRDDYDPSQQGSSVAGDGDYGMDRSHSTASTAVPAQAPSRSNTLKKKASMRRTGSLNRSSSKRSLVAAGSIKGVSGAQHQDKEYNSIFYTPIPTQGTPTEVLANRFQAWRQLLKSLIAYFREIQNSYDTRSKAVHKVQGVISGITHPSVFLTENGLGDATRILDDYHKHSIAEANKSRDIENDVIGALTGLRSDLGQKIKEIKSLSGDFKNSVDKEKEGTKREVEKLQEVLQHVDHEDGSATGKNDPFIVKLGVDKLVERQVDEENYLHRAYLNLESSGRELESIVVGEIQKAYNALAGILKREADDAYNVVEGLRGGPISIPKDQEWLQFVLHDPHFVDPNMPLRRIQDIEYPGKHNPAATEVRAGMLERKSKYLKS
ncbi:phosphatidylinositol 4,5-bisphosphate-binding protein, partial [Friedmanniomyces endolithicus]